MRQRTLFVQMRQSRKKCYTRSPRSFQSEISNFTGKMREKQARREGGGRHT